jgi:hypothetical protein
MTKRYRVADNAEVCSHVDEPPIPARLLTVHHPKTMFYGKGGLEDERAARRKEP